MSNLEYAVRQICYSSYTKEIILDTNSNILAYSILSGKPLEDIRHIDPIKELNENQLEDFQEICTIIRKIKYDIKDFNTIL